MKMQIRSDRMCRILPKQPPVHRRPPPARTNAGPPTGPISERATTDRSEQWIHRARGIKGGEAPPPTGPSIARLANTK